MRKSIVLFCTTTDTVPQSAQNVKVVARKTSIEAASLNHAPDKPRKALLRACGSVTRYAFGRCLDPLLEGGVVVVAGGEQRMKALGRLTGQQGTRL